MARERVHWLAGPVGYKLVESGVYPDRTIALAKWDFVGVTSGGAFRRWNLTFSMKTRQFTANTLSVTQWDTAHAKELADIYRPSAVLRHELPKGSVVKAMRAMISEKDMATVVGLAITNGRA